MSNIFPVVMNVIIHISFFHICISFHVLVIRKNISGQREGTFVILLYSANYP